MNLLRDAIRNCNSCPLRATVPIRPVPGQGLPTARIMLIKEKISHQEGLMEDNLLTTQVRFVRKLFSAIGVKPEDLYVTSIVKCSCETMRVSYVKECIGWLEEEIRELNPRVILVLGSGTEKWINRFFPTLEYTKLKTVEKLMTTGDIIDHAQEIRTLIDAVNK